MHEAPLQISATKKPAPLQGRAITIKISTEKIYFSHVASGLVGSEESDLGFPLHPEYAIQTDANWYFLHGIFG